MRWWCSDGIGVGLDRGNELRDHALHSRHLRLQNADPICTCARIWRGRRGRSSIFGWLFEDAFDADLSASAARWVLGAVAARFLFATGIAGAMHPGDGLVDLDLFSAGASVDILVSIVRAGPGGLEGIRGRVPLGGCSWVAHGCGCVAERTGLTADVGGCDSVSDRGCSLQRDLADCK